MTNYEKGRRFEYRVRDLFRDHGFFVIRAAQSKPVDLVCVKNGKTILVECKTNKKAFGQKASLKLLKAVALSQAEIVLAYKENRKIRLLNAKTNDFCAIHD